MTDPVERVAVELERRRLAAPARLLVDAHRPLAPLLSDLGAALGPLVGSAFGRGAADVASLLTDEGALDRLVERLDANRPTAKPDAEPG